MRYLIFDSDVGGHHLEYCHHLYTLAASCPNDYFIFLYSPEMQDLMIQYEWIKSQNIKFYYLSDCDLKKCKDERLLRAAWNKSKIIRKYVKQKSIDKVWLIMLMQLMPFLPFFLPKRIKITGIIYRLYFYESSKMSAVRLFLEKVRYWILAKNSKIEKAFILNDVEMVNVLNNRYNTSHFYYLPDPIPKIDRSKLKDIKEEIGISQKTIMYLHFGGLTKRKGTLEILKAIQLLDVRDLKDKAFVFAGKLYPDISEEFYGLLADIKHKVKIIVYDEFCSPEHLNSLCYSCDVILIPYTNTNQSSGVIGYAAYFGKPVVGPKGGLLGHLIESYNMGVTMESVSADNLSKFIKRTIPICGSEYGKSHTVNDFLNSFMT